MLRRCWCATTDDPAFGREALQAVMSGGSLLGVPTLAPGPNSVRTVPISDREAGGRPLGPLWLRRSISCTGIEDARVLPGLALSYTLRLLSPNAREVEMVTT